MDPSEGAAPLVQLVPLWGSVPPRNHHHLPSTAIVYLSLWVKLIYPCDLKIISTNVSPFFLARFSQNFPKPKNCNCFHHPERQMLARTLWRSRPLLAPKNSCCAKCVHQLNSFCVNRSTASQTYLFSLATKVYDVNCSFVATPERNATTTLPRKPCQNFTAFSRVVTHLGFRNLSSLTKDSCSGLGLEHQKYWQVFCWKKPAWLS